MAAPSNISEVITLVKEWIADEEDELARIERGWTEKYSDHEALEINENWHGGRESALHDLLDALS